ncbi:hypothetical protein ACFL35_21360 [Candidatus Riflebacteria bacterium]
MKKIERRGFFKKIARMLTACALSVTGLSLWLCNGSKGGVKVAVLPESCRSCRYLHAACEEVKLDGYVTARAGQDCLLTEDLTNAE